MKEIAKYSGCFVCGDNNDFGLKVKFYFQDNKAIAECVAQRHFEGYHDFYHGGITAALLDEVMIKALTARDIPTMTVELTVRYHKAVVIGQKLLLEGCLEHQRGRLYLTRGEAKLESGEIVASATGKYLQVRRNMESKLQESPEN